MSNSTAYPIDMGYDLEEGELIEEVFFTGNNGKDRNTPNALGATTDNMKALSTSRAPAFKRKTPSAVVKRKRIVYFTSDEEDDEDDPGPVVKRNRSTTYVRSEDTHLTDTTPIDDSPIDNAPNSTTQTNSAPINNAPISNAPVDPSNSVVDLTNGSKEERGSPPSKRTRSKVKMSPNAKGHLYPSQISQYRTHKLGTAASSQSNIKHPHNSISDSGDEEDTSRPATCARSAAEPGSEEEPIETTSDDSEHEIYYEKVADPSSGHPDSTANLDPNDSNSDSPRLTQKRSIDQMLSEYAALVNTEDYEEAARTPPRKKQKIRPGKQPRKPAPPPPKKDDKPFRLLDLPGDIRIMIYDYLFFGKGRKIRRPSTHVAGKKFHRPKLDTAIIRTCRALYDETHDFLSKRAHITLPLTRQKKVGYQMQQPDLTAFLAFKKVTLEAWVKKPIEYKPRDKQSGMPTIGETKLGRAFQELVPMLRVFDVLKSPAAKKQVWVDLCPMYDMGTEDEDALEEQRKTFVSTWHHDVKVAAPGVDVRRVSRKGGKVWGW